MIAPPAVGCKRMLAGCRKLENRRPRREPRNVPRQVGTLAAEPRCLCRAKTGSFGAPELVVPTVANKYRLRAVNTEPPHRLKIDVRFRLRRSSLEREHGCVKALSGWAVWPRFDVLREAVADDGQTAPAFAQSAKNPDGDWIESLKQRGFLETAFVAEAVHTLGVEPAAQHRADFQQGVSE
jgi:hypothetical protein